MATRKPLYFAGGLLAGSVAAVIAYKLFNHVRVRVVAWKTPLKVIDKEGYPVSYTHLLMLNKERIAQMAEGIRQVAELEDPVGEVLSMKQRPNGLMRCV